MPSHMRSSERLSSLFISLLFLSLIASAVTARVMWGRSFDFRSGIAVLEPPLEDYKLSTASQIFEARLKQYQATSGDIRTMLYGMVVITGIAIYYTVARPKTFQLPFLNIQADAAWLRWTCPAILTYLWLHFGYALYSAVLSRVFLLDLGSIIEASLHADVARENPLKYAIEDGGIGDFLFYLHSPVYSSTRTPINTVFSWFLLIGLYSGLLGVVHGCILRGVSLCIESASHKTVSWIYFGLLALLLLGSHLAFAEMLSAFWVPQVSICVFGAGSFLLLGLAAKARWSRNAKNR